MSFTQVQEYAFHLMESAVLMSLLQILSKAHMNVDVTRC